MSTESVLGESWVVASSPSAKELGNANNSSPRAPDQKRQSSPQGEHRSESTMSASSMSGPELIMPSIYETPVSESSWVAPTVRSKKANPNLKRRHHTSHETASVKTNKSNQDDLPRPTPRERNLPYPRFLKATIRTITNILLLTAISHLLVLPELVQQYQTLCSMNVISALYPSSCIPPFPQPLMRPQQASARHESVITSQTRLETLFNTTLLEMAPLTSSLKHTESRLRDVEKELKRAHPGTKHELDLEFASCWQAIRIAAWKFDTLKADLQSAVDSLIAAGEVRVAAGSRSSAAQDTRISTQMSRREQYLEQLTARMRSKADSLAADLARLDDHLESIESILDRETKLSSSWATRPDGSSPMSSAGSQIWALIDDILPGSVNLPSFLRLGSQGSSDRDCESSISPLPLSQIFHEATTYHQPVANLARNLSDQLQQILQAKKNTPL